MSRAGEGGSEPQAIIHKNILQVAEKHPKATLDEIAEQVAGASTDLVDRVLNKYGDPGEQPVQDTSDHSASQAEMPHGEGGSPETMNEENPAMESANQSANGAEDEKTGHSELELVEPSEKQLKVLRLLYERPEATQAELADELDVTRATISRRLNQLEGFEWKYREAFLENLPEELLQAGDPDPVNQTSQAEPTPEEDGRPSRIETLADRLDSLEAKLDGEDTTTSSSVLSPELTHKVIRSSIRSDEISQSEELEIIRHFMGDE